jgi:hypothetical protein
MIRPATLLFALAASWAIITTGCGSGDDDPDGSPTSAVLSTAEASVSPEGQPQPTTPDDGPSATPAPTETPEATATSTPPPPAELTFDRPDSGDGTKTAGSFGPLGIVYADSTYGVVPDQNRMHASAHVNVGINERPSATAWLSNLFRVPGDGAVPITVQISTGVNWQGILAGNGAGGTRAAVSISLSVVDEGRVVATEPVHSLEQRESLLTLGGFADIDRADADMQVALTPGVYELRLTVKCDASSGLIGVATHCIYGPSDTYDDGFVAWEPRTILFVP